MLQATRVSPRRSLGCGSCRGSLGYTASENAGLPAANANVKALQVALAAWAAKGHPASAPGRTDGVLDPTTRNAVVATLPSIPGLPHDAVVALQAAVSALGVAEAVSQSAADAVAKALDGVITTYSSALASAINLMMTLAPANKLVQMVPISAAARQIMTNHAAATTASSSSSWLPPQITSWLAVPTGKSWYNVWWGKGLIGALAVGGLWGAYKLVE
jgi:hypothetical protein